MKRVYSILFLILCFAMIGKAQIGIDNPTPNAYSSLDLKAFDKGMLVPRMTTAERFTLRNDCAANGQCPNGLLVFDTDLSVFFYMLSSQWYLLNPFISPDVMVASNEDIELHAIVQNVGIGVTPAAGYKLDVNGKLMARNGVVVTSNNVNVNSGDVSVSLGSITVNSGNVSCDRINSDTKITTAGFSTDITDVNCAGPVPKGGIIAWSGTILTIPSGWALCDGNNGTPNLSGRFVISPGTRPKQTYTTTGSIVLGGNITFSKGDVGGSDLVVLSINQLPSHNHNIIIDSETHSHRIVGDDGGGGSITAPYYAIQVDVDCTSCFGNFHGYVNHDYHSHPVTEQFTGNDNGHYNMPPYYVLAFIMKL